MIIAEHGEVWNTATNQWDPVQTEPTAQPGRPRKNRPVYAPQWKTNIRSVFPFHTAETMPTDATEYTRHQPRAAADIENRVYIPAAIASFVGVLSWPVYIGALGYLNVGVEYSMSLACATALLTFTANVKRANGLLYVAERATNHDINGDGHIGEPVEEEPDHIVEEVQTEEDYNRQFEPPEPQRFEIDLRHSNNHSQHYGLDIPPTIVEKLPKVAHAIQLGVAFSRPQLVDKRNLLTQSEFRQLKSILHDAGFVQSVEGNKTKVTPAGRSFLSNFENA